MQAGERLHLIGSIPLATSEEVFRTLADRSSALISAACPTARPASARAGSTSRARCCAPIPTWRSIRRCRPTRSSNGTARSCARSRRSASSPASIPTRSLFETGYDKAAAASYEIFKRLRDSGAIAKGTRFQVSLPTPHSSGYLYVSGPARQTYFEVYERALLKALANIVKAIPAPDLAIQWDVCQEVLAFENYFKDRPADYKKQTFDMLGRLGDAVPAGVELGYHLCYGSPADEHLVQPKDAAILVEMLEGIAARHQAAASTSSISRCRRSAPTRPSTRRSRTGSGRRAPSSISGCCTTTTKQATERASPSRRNSSTISGSRPNAAGAGPSRAGCPVC